MDNLKYDTEMNISKKHFEHAVDLYIIGPT